MQEFNRDCGILSLALKQKLEAAQKWPTYIHQSMSQTKIEEIKHEETKISLCSWKQVSMRRNLVATRGPGASQQLRLRIFIALICQESRI